MTDSRVDQAGQALTEAQTLLTDLLDDEPAIVVRQQLRLILTFVRDAVYYTNKLHTPVQRELPL